MGRIINAIAGNSNVIANVRDCAKAAGLVARLLHLRLSTLLSTGKSGSHHYQCESESSVWQEVMGEWSGRPEFMPCPIPATNITSKRQLTTRRWS